MAHELDFSTGDAAYTEIGTRITAWHGEGTPISPQEFGALGWDQRIALILERARLDWTVDPHDVYDADGSMIRGWKAFRRSDTGRTFGVFRESYTILQNAEMFELVRPLLEEGIIEFDTAGALRGGTDVWSLCKFRPNNEAVAAYFARQKININLLVANNHDYRRTLTFMETPVRVICANTLSTARQHGGSNTVALKHTPAVRSMSVEAIHLLWGTLTQRYAAVMQSYEALRQKYLTQEAFEAHVLDVLAPLPTDTESQLYESTLNRAIEKRDLVSMLYAGGGRGLEDDSGTAWAAYNAAVEAVDHYPDRFPVRGESRLRALYPGGSLAAKKQAVLDSLMALSV